MRPRPCALIGLLLALSACSERRLLSVDPQLQADLSAIQGMRIFFGHQSVGGNILDGVASLARQAGVPITITSADDYPRQNSFFAQSLIGRNGEPGSKCEAFREQIEKRNGKVDIALMKFCYIDFDQDSRVDDIFEQYASTIASLEARSPNTAFIHVTAPLKSSGSGVKRLVKDMLGLPDAARLANLKRSRYNELLRERFRGQPIFDLAAIESTDPEGRTNTFTMGSQTGYSLVTAYTADGGHLNELGRRIAARELIRTLATVARESHAAQIVGRVARPHSEEVSK